MKHIKTTALLVAAISFAFTACDKKSTDGGSGNPAKPAVVDEKTAIANFKTEVEGVTKWMDEKKKTTNAADPMAGIAAMGEMVTKFKGIKTDGLPADLKGAWGEMTGIMGEMGDIFKGVPTGKPEDAAKAMETIMPKMMGILGKVEPVAKKLEEIGKKYGLDMSKVGPG